MTRTNIAWRNLAWRNPAWRRWALLVLIATGAVPLLAQGDGDRQALRAELEQRFSVLPLREGVVLEPRQRAGGVRAVQVTGGDITIDGDPVTGAELRQRLGDAAAVVVRLSYLTAAEQRALFSAAPVDTRPNDAAAPAVPVAPDEPRRPRPPRSFRSREADRVRIGGSVRINEGETVNDVVAIGGSASVDGQVRGDVVAIGGDLELGPHADVTGDVTVVGGVMRRDPAARVGGSVNDVGWGQLNFIPRNMGAWRFWPGGAFLLNSAMGSVVALLTTLTRVAVLCLLASIVLLFGRGYVEQVGGRAAAEPLKSGLVGLVIQLLFVPVLIVTMVAMIVTIIGIPLLTLVPFAVFALALLLLIGFTAVAFDVGRLAVARLGWPQESPYLIAAVGVAVTLSPVLVARLVGLAGGFLMPFAWALLGVGFFVEYAAWTVGLGAVALARFDRKAPIPTV